MGEEASSARIPMIELSHAMIDAVEVGYRHFDTATIYFTEEALGQGISYVLERCIVKSRDELFITANLWCAHAHPHLILPALKTSLNLKPGLPAYPIKSEDFLPFDMKGVWPAMEECQKLGLTKSIGVSNFTRKKLQQLLAVATIPQFVNQVEVNPTWQQKELIEFCKQNRIMVTAYSSLDGLLGGHSGVMKSNVLKEIAKAKGKTVAQVALTWGTVVVAKSYSKDRMKHNLDIFN